MRKEARMRLVSRILKKTVMIVTSLWATMMYLVLLALFVVITPVIFTIGLLSSFSVSLSYETTRDFLDRNEFSPEEVRKDFKFFFSHIYEACTY